MLRALTTFICFLPFLGLAKEKAAVDAKLLKHPVKAALWKVEGKGLEKPSYLFGTVHLADPRITTLNPKVEAAFKASTHFYAEIDLDPAAQIKLAPMMMRQDGKTLNDSIGPDLTKALNKRLKKINPEMTSQLMQPLKTWAVYATLPVLKFQMENPGKAPLDQVLYMRAQKEEKTVDALETAESQLKIFEGLKEAEQVALLKGTLEFMDKEEKEGTDSVQEMVDTYLTQEPSAIGALVKKYMEEDQGVDPELAKRLMKALLDDRNITMAETIAKKLTEAPSGSHFFAAGVAHYTGSSAIQDLLEKKGYTITPTF